MHKKEVRKMSTNERNTVKVTFTNPSKDWTYSTKTMFSSAANVNDNLSKYVDNFTIDDSDPKDIRVTVSNKYTPTLLTVPQMLNLELARSGLMSFEDVFKDEIDENDDDLLALDDEILNDLLEHGGDDIGLVTFDEETSRKFWINRLEELEVQEKCDHVDPQDFHFNDEDDESDSGIALDPRLALPLSLLDAKKAAEQDDLSDDQEKQKHKNHKKHKK